MDGLCFLLLQPGCRPLFESSAASVFIVYVGDTEPETKCSHHCGNMPHCE